jgi:WhiB family transcriptional regulator, redox-sensing transcriptional regulator
MPNEDPRSEEELLAQLEGDVGRYGRAWRTEAACRDMDTTLFFPVGRTGEALDTTARAKRVCASCKVRASCLAFALNTNQQRGIWGGCDEEDLWRLRRSRRRRRVSDRG